MHNLLASVGIFTLLIFSIGGFANYNFYASEVYEVHQIAEILHNAQSTTDLADKAVYMSQVLYMLEDYRDNPKWLFPMDYTNFDNIKRTLSSMVETTIELNDKVDVDAMSYQQSLSVIDTTVETIHDRIHTSADALNENPTRNPFTWGFLLIASVLGVVALVVIDWYRNGDSWY